MLVFFYNFVRSGEIDVQFGKLEITEFFDDDSGQWEEDEGYYWSSRASSSNGAYHLTFNSWNSVVPSNSYLRDNGISLRCLSTVLE